MHRYHVDHPLREYKIKFLLTTKVHNILQMFHIGVETSALTDITVLYVTFTAVLIYEQLLDICFETI